MIEHFYYHPRMLEYDFGEQHPLKPERLKRTIELLQHMCSGLITLDPGLATREQIESVHSKDYVRAVEAISSGEALPNGYQSTYGFGNMDNPPFHGMFEASLSYCAGSIKAAEAVRDGASVAFNLSGGLHHAMYKKASGFCIFNDPALAIFTLKWRFDRIAYIDIDVHHGDGVQWLFFDDPSVLTCSIHEDPATIFPGTGGITETGPHFTSLNIPLPARTSGDVWLDAFKQTVLPAIGRFEPQAIVLQMGTDPHFEDPLGHLKVASQEWLAAVKEIARLKLPTVALGGGGYNLTTVPRMWASAVLSLAEIPFADEIPVELGARWGMPTFSDATLPEPRNKNRQETQEVVDQIRNQILPLIPSPG